MLAGYLPFDDDPANPEGDNINLLYKYITTTPLTFPEYVTPHARDLLRRILVPDPRKRADLFEVARHSWLSDFAHVVSQVTSNATTLSDIANTTVTACKLLTPDTENARDMSQLTVYSGPTRGTFSRSKRFRARACEGHTNIGWCLPPIRKSKPPREDGAWTEHREKEDGTQPQSQDSSARICASTESDSEGRSCISHRLSRRRRLRLNPWHWTFKDSREN